MIIDKLHNQLQTFFQTDKFDILPLGEKASARKYYEITFKKKLYFPSKKILLISMPIEEAEALTDYVHIDFYLSRVGIPATRIYEMKKQFGWIFTEHHINPTILDYLKKHPDKTPAVLEKLAEFLIIMQERCEFDDQCPAFQRILGRERYRHEFNFYVKEQLLSSHHNLQLTKKQTNDFQRFAVDISTTLDTEDRVFVHGDFQSSNIHYNKADDNLPFKITNFHGAQYGSPIYDLVSCLWDSYIPVSDDIRETLLEKSFQHQKELGTSLTKDGFQKLVDYAVIQRKLRDAGVFASNFKRAGKKKFSSLTSASIQMAVEKMKRYTHFKKMIKLFEPLGEKSS